MTTPKTARTIWCNGCVLRTSYCPDKKTRHCEISNKFLHDLYTLILQEGVKDKNTEKILDDFPLISSEELNLLKSEVKAHNACNALWFKLLERIFEQERKER